RTSASWSALPRLLESPAQEPLGVVDPVVRDQASDLDVERAVPGVGARDAVVTRKLAPHLGGHARKLGVLVGEIGLQLFANRTRERRARPAGADRDDEIAASKRRRKDEVRVAGGGGGGGPHPPRPA